MRAEVRGPRAECGLALLAVLAATPAFAVTWQVGPTRALTQLIQVNANPGDIIEIDGNATYNATQWTRSGNAGNPITIRGITIAGKRPTFSGGTNTLEIQANNVVVENLELTAGTFRCFYHHGNNVTLRDSVVHGCPAHGILGADQDSGNFTLEGVEVYGCGNGTSQHQIYMATDEVTFPGSVFRMRFCYVHDATGGNNVKSRAERNEIQYNWIEGATYHELELIGPDPNGAKLGWAENLAREDSDVVGNVLVKRNASSFVTRIGGDGTGQSLGRYRFVNNTVVVQPGGSAVFRLFQMLESVEMHNNVFVVAGAGAPNIMRAVVGTEMDWVGNVRRVSGANNYVITGATNVPSEWIGTLNGTNPGFVDGGQDDFRPAIGSPLINAGTLNMPSPPDAGFPNPLPFPLFHPPMHAWMAADAGVPRPDAGLIDLGAFEFWDGGVSDGGAGGGAGGSGGGTGGAGGSGGGSGGAGGSGGGAGGSGGGGGATDGGTGGGTGSGGTGGTAGPGPTGSGGNGGGGSNTGGCSCASSGGLLFGVLCAVTLFLPRRRKHARH